MKADGRIALIDFQEDGKYYILTDLLAMSLSVPGASGSTPESSPITLISSEPKVMTIFALLARDFSIASRLRSS